MNEVKRKLDENCVRVIKISKKALFEIIYEKFIEEQEAYLDVDALEVIDTFDINYERGEFVFCAYKSENAHGEICQLPKGIDLQQLMTNIPDTTTTMFAADRYKEYTIDELVGLSR